MLARLFKKKSYLLMKACTLDSTYDSNISKRAHAKDSRKGLKKRAHAKGSRKGLTQRAHAKGARKRPTQKAHAKGLTQKGSRKRAHAKGIRQKGSGIEMAYFLHFTPHFDYLAVCLQLVFKYLLGTEKGSMCNLCPRFIPIAF